ncbi:hypothetical protein [Thiocystis violacea]|uniref:hypothetical protein n=1 Tax=Thiocystis violacea TaxID=13725 RepID=UPI001907DE53|nr:hypothetical protein [Thiocystis violacea]MBK1718841.1 hypothetical protein [Thiocystis violacea]
MRIPPALLLLLIAQPPSADPVIIGHPGIPQLDMTTLQRIYTGKIVEVNGTRVSPVNLEPGHALRLRFLDLYMKQDDEKYIGYWTVRRYVGKGTPPRELTSAEEVLHYVSETSGAIGYIDASQVGPGVMVVFTRP